MRTQRCRVNKQKNMEIELNNKFYSEKAISSTIEAYKDVCQAKLREDKKSIVIIDLKKDIDEETFKGEFCNYCLGMMKNITKQ